MCCIYDLSILILQFFYKSKTIQNQKSLCCDSVSLGWGQGSCISNKHCWYCLSENHSLRPTDIKVKLHEFSCISHEQSHSFIMAHHFLAHSVTSSDIYLSRRKKETTDDPLSHSGGQSSKGPEKFSFTFSLFSKLFKALNHESSHA